MQITFVTLNIWKGKLLDKVLAFLKQTDADIAVLQEVFNGTNPRYDPQFRAYSIIKRELNYQHAAFAPAFLDITTAEHVENGNAIFSRYPIRSYKAHFFDIPYGPYIDAPGNYERCPRNLLHARILVDSQRMNIFNTHGIYGLSGEDNQRRLALSNTIVSLITNKENVIPSADFKPPPQTETI